jgi:hypothetical protein
LEAHGARVKFIFFIGNAIFLIKLRVRRACAAAGPVSPFAARAPPKAVFSPIGWQAETHCKKDHFLENNTMDEGEITGFSGVWIAGILKPRPLIYENY